MMGFAGMNMAGNAGANLMGAVSNNQTSNANIDSSNGESPNFCPNCGTKTNGTNFCSNCGSKLK